MGGGRGGGEISRSEFFSSSFFLFLVNRYFLIFLVPLGSIIKKKRQTLNFLHIAFDAHVETIFVTVRARGFRHKNLYGGVWMGVKVGAKDRKEESVKKIA